METSLAIALIFVLAVAIFKFMRTDRNRQSNISPQSIKKVRAVKDFYGDIGIFFGSQTGTAARFALELSNQARANGFKPKLVDLSDFRAQDFMKNKLGIFVVATYGEGEPTDNAKDFFKFLKGKSSDGDFDFLGFQYSVFALGSTQYQHFCRAGKTVDQQLNLRGARRVYKFGTGDNNSSIEDHFATWKSSIWQQLRKIRPVVQRDYNFIETDLSPFLRSALHSEKDAPLINFALTYQPVDDKGFTYSALQANYQKSLKEKVIENKKIKAEAEDAIHQLVIALENQHSVSPTDYISLYPQNSKEIVEEVLLYFKVDKKTIIHLVPKDQDVVLPFKSGYVVDILTRRVDLSRQIKTTKEFPFIPKNAKKPTISTLFQWIRTNKISVSFGLFLNYCHIIQPRVLINSSGKASDKIQCILKIKQNGLLSRHTIQVQANSTINLSIRPSSFKNYLQRAQLILIAQGIGIAAFKAIIQYKQQLTRKGKQGPLINLFYNYGSQEQILFKQQIVGSFQQGLVNKLKLNCYKAAPKKTIGMLLKEDKELINQVLLKSQRGAVLICGSIELGKQSCSTLRIILNELTKSKKDMVRILQEADRIAKQLW